MQGTSAVSLSVVVSVSPVWESVSVAEPESDDALSLPAVLLLSAEVESVGVDTCVFTQFPLRQISPVEQSRLDLHSLSLQLHEETRNAREPNRNRYLKFVYAINMTSPYSFPIPLLP
jgi:hypothetical protein